MDPKKASLLRYFIGVALPGIVTCFISGYFSYSKSKFEAEIGYKELADAVKEIQPALQHLELKVAKLEGRIDSLQHMATPVTSSGQGYGAGVGRLGGTGHAGAAPRPVPVVPAPTPPPHPVGGVPYRPMKALPDTLNDAVQQMKK